MTTSTPADNTVLALSPPQVTGQTETVVGADIGVPLVAYDLVTDGEGAVVFVDPPFTGTMDPGDVMELWLKDELAALDSEIIADPNVRTRLRIPKGRLLPNRVNELYYTITRSSQNIGILKPPLTILYNKIRPGLKDKYDASGGHSELKLLLPDVIKNGVGADFVSADVCVSYPYCRAYDRITLKCNGELMTANVNPNQAPQPPSHGFEEPITICFTITRAFLDKAKRLDQKLYFSYTVTDQIGNGPDTDAPWSPVQVVDEDLDGKRLPKPILLERLEDFPGDDPEEIDLKKLAGNPLLLVVLTADNRFLAGDDVLATYTAQDTGQPAGVVVNVSGKVAADPFGVKKTLFLEVPNAKVFASSRVTVTYELRRPNGDLVGNSITANATVTGITPIDLLPPFLVAPAVDPVDVLAYPNGVTMRIEYLAALDGDRARLAEVNPPADSPQFPLVAFNSNKRVNTVLTPAYLAARQGKTFELRWNLNRNGAQAGKSTPTPVRVLKIADGDPRLPTPKILQAPDDKVLDLNTFEGNAELTVLPWLGISTDNVVQLKLTGKGNNNDDYVIHVLTNHKITEQEKTFGIKESLPREKLSIVQHATSIQVTLELLPSPASTSIIFPILILHFLNAPQVITESFETGKVEWKDEGTIMDFPSMTVTVIKGPVALDGNAAIEYAPFLTGNYFHLNVDETLRFTLKRPSKSVRFGIAARIKSTALTECYDEDFKLIKAQSTQSYDAPHQAWVDVTETVNRKIKYLDVTIKGFATTRLDNFSLFY